MINLPIFGQRDSRWSGKMLGTSKTSSLGNYGCLITSWAMVCKYYGKDTDPNRLNTALIGVNGFAKDSFFVWGAISKIYSDITESKNIQTPNPVTPAQFALFDAELNAGRPIIVGVDFNPGTVLVESHFIVIIGGSNGQYTIADPWYGDTASLSRYGDPAKTIQRFVFINGHIPNSSYKGYDLGNPDSMKVAVDVLVQLQSGELVRKEDMAKLQGQIDDLKSSQENLSKIVNELRLSIGEKDKDISTITSEITVLKNDNQKLTEDLAYYKPYKSRYEEALSKVPNSLTGLQLISLGMKKLWESRKLANKK